MPTGISWRSSGERNVSAYIRTSGTDRTISRLARMDAQDRAFELVERYDEELRRLLPAGADIFDAHLHLGQDIDGMVGDYDQLESLMGAYGISRAFMFCLDEPDREPAFTAAND